MVFKRKIKLSKINIPYLKYPNIPKFIKILQSRKNLLMALFFSLNIFFARNQSAIVDIHSKKTNGGFQAA
jgi:hypothetical protein